MWAESCFFFKQSCPFSSTHPLGNLGGRATDRGPVTRCFLVYVWRGGLGRDRPQTRPGPAQLPPPPWLHCPPGAQGLEFPRCPQLSSLLLAPIPYIPVSPGVPIHSFLSFQNTLPSLMPWSPLPRSLLHLFTRVLFQSPPSLAAKLTLLRLHLFPL